MPYDKIRNPFYSIFQADIILLFFRTTSLSLFRMFSKKFWSRRFLFLH